MNILFIHEIDWLRKVVFEIHTLSELLSLSGHRVYAIDYESMWQRDNPLDFGTLRTKVVEGVCRSYPGASVSLIRPGFIKIPGLSRLTAAFSHCREIRKTIREKDIDAIILYSVPTNGLPTLHHARKYGVPVIFRSIDIPHRLVPCRLLSPVTRALERKVYAGADLVLTISPRLSRYVTGLGAAEGRVKLLRLGIDTALFQLRPDSGEVRRQWGLGDGPIIVFMGTLFDFSGLDGFIRRFPAVLEKVPTARLLIVGDGPQRPELDDIINRLNLQKQVVITGFQPYETMPDYINTAAVCINTFLTTEVTRDIFPTKIVQYMACGKPVLATPLPGMKDLVPDEEQGILYADSPGAVADAAVALLESEERRRRIGRAALDYVKQHHSYDKIVQQLENELGLLVGSKKE